MKRLFFVASIMTVAAATFLSAQNYKIAVVNTEIIIKELPEAQQASKSIDEAAQKIRDTLAMMQKEFEARIASYRKQEAMMTSDARAKEEDAINGLRTRYLQYQEVKTAEVQSMRESFLKPIRENVQAAIDAIAREEKLNLVLDKAAGIVLYSEDKADITYKVLDKMKRGSK